MTGELISLSGQHPPSESATGQPQAITLPAPAGWPAPPEQAAYHGLPGAIVQKVAPHTEADPVAILAQLLVCCGALIGRSAHFPIEATLHHPNEFVILIGDSSKARICCAQHILAYVAPQPMLRSRGSSLLKRHAG